MRSDLGINDDGKLYRKFYNKKINAKKEGVDCLLTYEEFCNLVREARLTSSQIGFTTKEKYVLARYNDSGNYQIGNCRFITQRENAQEKKISEQSRKASSHNIKNFMNKLTEKDKNVINKKITESRHKNALIKQQKRREDFLKHANKSYVGERNSQYGTCWVSKDSFTKKIKKEFLDAFLKDGWVRGRKFK